MRLTTAAAMSIADERVAGSIYKYSSPLYITHSFTAMMPSGWVFILFCILLRMTEGVGSAMLSTASFSLLPELFPNRLATVMVHVTITSLVPRPHVLILGSSSIHSTDNP